MKFSVIVPVYNAKAYISKFYNSVCRQTFGDYEVILVDDGSTDGSGEILDSLTAKDERIKVVHQKNSRQLISRINGIKAAEGEYCVFSDVDDCLANNALEVLNAKINSYDNPDLVIYSFFYRYENGELKRANKLYPTEIKVTSENRKELLRKFISGTLLNNVWTKAVKRSVLTGGDYPDYGEYCDLLCAEDRLFSLGILDNAKSIVYTDEPLYIYNITGGSVTRNYSVSTIERHNTVKLLDIERDYFTKWEIDEKEDVERYEAQRFNDMIYVFDKYFNGVKTLKERKAVFSYNWRAFLDGELKDRLQENPYISPTHLKWWRFITDGKFLDMEIFMLKKRIINRLRGKR